uniref:Non-specific serine/threonine protein kinase n=1 Tax=Strongyloides venezuelensis TaxID=75913 RepID=A0A0K0G3B4_STRVS
MLARPNTFNNSKTNYSENSGRNSTTNSHSEQKSLGVTSDRRSSSRESVPSQRYSDENYVCNKTFDDLTKSKRGRPSKINRFQQALLNAREKRSKIQGNELKRPVSTGQKNTGNAPSTAREDGKSPATNKMLIQLRKVSTIMGPKNATNEQLIGAIILFGEKLEKMNTMLIESNRMILKKFSEVSETMEYNLEVHEVQYGQIMNAVENLEEYVKTGKDGEEMRFKRSRTIKCCLHLNDDNHTALMDASNKYILEKISKMEEHDYGRGREYEITSPELKKFLDNRLIKSEALKYINNTETVCKFVTDMLIPKKAILKYFFLTLKTKRGKKYLLSNLVVRTFYTATRYLGVGIINEGNEYLNHGIHLVTTRTLDKNRKNANVVFYSMKGIKTFFKMEHIQSQKEEEALMEL